MYMSGFRKTKPGPGVTPMRHYNIVHINIEDVAVTRALVEAGKLLDIECIDHIICGAAARFVSMKERRLGFG
jgi:hypothetical protein